ncbi:hypothetical protein CAP35_06690 [Chitinophagaceae bacterium IBVUCB1]|nr:hypothetical protein CAP35_06690 [Chitinophagaceae bacterium IBVUCB1]
MQEKLLQFIWQYSLYRPAGLQTTTGEPIVVVRTGRYNTNAGPDFLDARIRVGGTLLAGHVELHINHTDWQKHGHQHDEAYKNVILHVVYNYDGGNGAANTPVLELRDAILPDVVSKHAALMAQAQPIPCASQLHMVKDITKEGWLTRVLAERWEDKQVAWRGLLDSSAGDWRNLLYWRMAANFGFKLNADVFLELAQSIPHNVFAKGGSLLQTEAVLYGQAGMLDADFTDEYPNQQKKEYQYIKQKYGLTPLPAHRWKYLRLRPANFPTIRIAQFAALVHQSFHLFSQIAATNSVQEILPLLDVTASAYWDNHYRFDELTDKTVPKRLGTSSIHNIIINTIAPIRYLYAQAHGTDREQERALQLLDELPAEKNHIISQYADAGWKAINAAQGQAFIQLYNNYCSKKRCLECAVGLSLLKSSPHE